MKTLKKRLDEISFYEREKNNDKYIANKCGRDFLYYALNFYKPEKFNLNKNNPIDIDDKKLFGQPTPPFLAWTQIQFYKLPAFLKKQRLKLEINGVKINTYFDFVFAILFSRLHFKGGINLIERLIDNNIAVGVDISMGYFGLLDHVMFVYGYDENNLYIIDTHQIKNLEYKKTENKNVFILPKKIIRERWTPFGRVWVLTHI